MNSGNYYTILDVERIITHNIFGITFWECFITYIDNNNEIFDGATNFLNLNDATNLDTGDKILNKVVFDANINRRNNTFDIQ